MIAEVLPQTAGDGVIEREVEHLASVRTGNQRALERVLRNRCAVGSGGVVELGLPLVVTADALPAEDWLPKTGW